MKAAPAPARIVLAIAHDFAHGGVQRHFRRLAGALRDRGHEVHACAARSDGTAPPDLDLEVLSVAAASNHGRNAAFAARLAAFVRTCGEVDLVVGMTKLPGLDLYYAGDLCYRTRIEARALAPLLRRTRRYRALAAQEEAVFGRGRATRIMTTAPAAIADYRRGYDTEPERFTILPPGLDRERLAARRDFEPEPPDELRSGRPFILMVGSNFRTKGVDRAIRALAALPKARRGDLALVVVGQGKTFFLRALARRLGVGDAVVFAGPRDDVGAFYRRARLLLHPARIENTGNALIEALVCGLPVLTLAHCGFAFHVAEAGAGTVLPDPFDQGALDRALDAALSDRDRAAAWGKAGAAYAARTRLSGLVPAAVELIESMIAERRGGRPAARTGGVEGEPRARS